MDNKLKRSSAFTVLELMIAVAIVALLASLAIPGYQLAVQSGEGAALMGELRVTQQAFQLYAAEKGTYPNTATPRTSGGEVYGVIPNGMAPYLPKSSTWESSPKIGGNWLWLKLPLPVWGFSNYVGLVLHESNPDQIQRIDARLDDGNLSSGAMRLTGTLLLFGMN